MKLKHQRLVFVAGSMLFLIASTLLVMQAFKENLVFFYSPSDIASTSPSPETLIRVGGLVKAGSIKKHHDSLIEFSVTDNQNTLHISYTGMLPTLFREGQGVVAEGYLQADGHFKATRVLTKHDENYMPKEVVDSLKASGRWKESQ